MSCGFMELFPELVKWLEPKLSIRIHSIFAAEIGIQINRVFHLPIGEVTRINCILQRLVQRLFVM